MSSAPLAPRVNIYEAAAANRIRSIVLVGAFIALVAVLAFVFGELYAPGAGVAAVPAAFVFSTGSALASYYAGDKMILAMSKAREVTPAEEAELHNIVDALAIGSGLPKPRLYVIDDSAPNAFATGRDPKHASVTVTRGLLDKLDRAELEGVLAHELSHVGNRDIRLLLLVVVLVGTIALLSDWMLRSMRFGGVRRGRRDSGGAGGIVLLVGIALALLTPLIATLIQLAVSRQREYLADATGALLTRYPPALASALRKIAQDREALEVANKATAPLYFANPLKDAPKMFDGLFETHPPIAERIRRLEAM